MTIGHDTLTKSLGDQSEKHVPLKQAKEVHSEEKKARVVSIVGEWLELLMALRSEGERIKSKSCQ